MEQLHTLATVPLSVTQDIVQAYAELTNDFNPIHVDAAFAATTPMGRPIAHGTMSLCLIWQCLQRNFGAEVFTDLELEARFVKPVYIGDELTAGGEADPDNSGQYKVWVRGADGTDRIVATVRPVQPVTCKEEAKS
ncbi:MaoC family dehydratase [Achromobacter sp. F4_2707]|uniref:MaoC family dehydratase n=1 Tax=Achromobacter sp. F4_2707 TaxID=3114286 RepID=UPI0039C730E4